jgi:hypothetical protein
MELIKSYLEKYENYDENLLQLSWSCAKILVKHKKKKHVKITPNTLPGIDAITPSDFDKFYYSLRYYFLNKYHIEVIFSSLEQTVGIIVSFRDLENNDFFRDENHLRSVDVLYDFLVEKLRESHYPKELGVFEDVVLKTTSRFILYHDVYKKLLKAQKYKLQVDSAAKYHLIKI